MQKKLLIDDAVIQRLRRARLIEGRRPHLFVAANVASATANKAAYIRTRSQDDEFYIKLVLDYLGQFGPAKRQEIDGLLMTKLSDALNESQKRNKISNLLSNMRRNGRIRNTGARKAPR